jgi:hypothetical protein
MLLSLDLEGWINAGFPVFRETESFGRHGLYVVRIVSVLRLVVVMEAGLEGGRFRFFDCSAGSDFRNTVQFCDG